MTKLSKFAQRLPERAVLTPDEIAEIKGGKRFRTTSYAQFAYVKSIIRSYGYQTSSMVHGNEYCLEW